MRRDGEHLFSIFDRNWGMMELVDPTKDFVVRIHQKLIR
jgi:hypothetical protein